MSKETWTIHTAEKKKVQFKPLFIVHESPNEDNKDIECTGIQMKIDDEEYTFDFINMYQFIYFCCNEEMRRSLMTRYERRINMIPYDVIFKLSDEEIQAKQARRRIELPLDEVSVYYAKQQGIQHYLRNKFKFNFPIFKGRKT